MKSQRFTLDAPFFTLLVTLLCLDSIVTVGPLSLEISEAHGRGEMCSLVGVEGGHSVANSLPVLRVLYSLGVRYLTLTSTCNTQW